jgi:predicted O-methyltransferase YrrM
MSFINEEIENYIKYLTPNFLTDEMEELKNRCINDNIPLIRDDVANFLRFFSILKNPKNVLEIGTAYGFSASVFALNKGTFVNTIEKDQDRFQIAVDFFNKSKYENVNLIYGDALELIEKMENKFDLIFIDAAKGQYLKFLELSLEKLNIGGVIISDNVLLDGEIFNETNKKHKTIINRMKIYNEFLFRKTFNTILLPIGDGLALTTIMEEVNE